MRCAICPQVGNAFAYQAVVRKMAGRRALPTDCSELECRSGNRSEGLHPRPVPGLRRGEPDGPIIGQNRLSGSVLNNVNY
jgi:hypothetical protein